MLTQTKEYNEELRKAQEKFYNFSIEGDKKGLREWAKNYLVVSYIDEVLNSDSPLDEEEFENQLCDCVASFKALERLEEKKAPKSQNYVCSRCDHLVVATEKPEPIRWTDGHVCYFRLERR